MSKELHLEFDVGSSLKILKTFKNIWLSRTIGHCETILIHPTKVIRKDFKGKYRKLQQIT